MLKSSWSGKDGTETPDTEYIYIYIVSKVGDLSQEWPEGSLFNISYAEV